MATNWVVGQQYTPTNFVRTGQAPGQVYADPTWGISGGNPGKLKEVRGEYGDFQFANGSGWAKLSDLQFAPAPTVAPTTTPTAQTITPSMAPPTQTSQVSPYLDKVQNQLNTLLKMSDISTKSDTERMGDITKAVTPSTPAPEAPKLVDLYSQLGKQYNVDQLMSSVTYWDDQINTLQDQLYGDTLTERGKPVPMNVIEGRVGEQESEAMIRINFASNQKNRAVNALNMANTTISTIMDLTQKDYANAAESYNNKFNQNLQLYETFKQEKTTQFEQATTLINMEQKAIEQDKANATANLGIYTDLISSGKMTYDSLPTATKLSIQQMEIASGLGVGFTAGIIAENANGKIMTTVTRQDASGMEYADTLMQMPDGSIKVVTTPLGQARLPEGSGGSSNTASGLTQSQQNSLVDYGIKVLTKTDIQGRIDAGNAGAYDEYGQWTKYSTEQEGKMTKDDYLLSVEEASKAMNQIIAYVGDEETGKMIFDLAMNAGGFDLWQEIKPGNAGPVSYLNKPY